MASEIVPFPEQVRFVDTIIPALRPYQNLDKTHSFGPPCTTNNHLRTLKPNAYIQRSVRCFPDAVSYRTTERARGICHDRCLGGIIPSFDVFEPTRSFEATTQCPEIIVRPIHVDEEGASIQARRRLRSSESQWRCRFCSRPVIVCQRIDAGARENQAHGAK